MAVRFGDPTPEMFAGFKIMETDLGDGIKVWRIIGRVSSERPLPPELENRSFDSLEATQNAIFRYYGLER